MKITRQTMRADGITVGQAMDRDAAFLRTIGFDAKDGAKTFDEIDEERSDLVRNAVLDALDSVLGSERGWADSDLANLFPALDRHLAAWKARNFNASLHSVGYDTSTRALKY